MSIEVRQPNPSGRDRSGGSSSSANPDKVKAIVAGVILAVAVLAFVAFNTNLFSGGAAKPPTEEEAVQQQEEWEEIQKEAEDAWRPSRPGERRPTPSGA